MMRKAAVLLVVVLGLLACFSASPEKKYYQIDLAPAPPGAAWAKTILVDRIDVDSLYDDFRILYRVSPVEINYYAYHFWAEKPARMLHDALLHSLELSRRFARVLSELGKEEPDWVLRCTVHHIEEVDAPAAWAARLGMKIELAEFKSGNVLASRRFDRQEPLARKDVSLVPAALSRILDEELAALFAEMRGKG
jgi:ABC-type uncharacterized transport system auxiliary subunit